MLDVRRLQVLKAVVDTGSLTGAAAELSYTPSAVHQHIAALERETGMVLLERSGRRVRPTDAAVLLRDHAATILATIDEAERSLDALRTGRVGRVRLAAFPTAGSALVPPALADFQRRFPDVDLDVAVLEPDEAIAALHDGTIDVAVIVHRFDAPDDGLVHRHLLSDPFRVVLPRGHALAGRRAIDLTQLAAERWISTCSPTGFCQDIASDACRAAGFEPRYAMEGDEYTTSQGYVAAGLGVALVPRLALEAAAHPGVVVRPVRHAAPAREVYASTRASMADTPLVAAMIDSLTAAAGAFDRSPAGAGTGAGALRR